MKNLLWDSNSSYMKFYMFATGADRWSLPENTCALFWKSLRMIILLPFTILGSIVHATVSIEDGRLWGRFAVQLGVIFVYFLLLMVGDSTMGAMFFEVEEGKMLLPQLSWFAFVWLPIVGAAVVAIPIAIVVFIGLSIYQGFVVVKEKYEDAAIEHFGIEMDHETQQPKNKFLAVLYMIHDKTCAKITWK